MSDWNTKNLANLAIIKGGKRLPAGQEFAEFQTPYPYLRVTNMVKASIDDSDLEYVPVDIEPIIRNYKISKNDLYVTIAGTLGKFGAIPDHLDNAQLTENAAKISNIDSNSIDKYYLLYFLNSQLMKKQIYREIGIGGGVPKLALHRIEKLEIDYPSLVYQQKIAKILSTCDTVISQTEQVIKKSEAIKQGMMTDLFIRGIDVSTGKLRTSYEEQPDLYKESELGWIPKDWEVKNLGDVTSLITDGAHFSPTPQKTGLPIGNVKDMLEDTFDYAKCTKIDERVFNELTRQNCSPLLNDILLSKDGTVGKVIHFKDDREIVLLSSIAIIRAYEDIDSHFLSWVLQSFYFDKALYKLLSGSALKRITLKDIKKIEFACPILHDEQLMIAKRLESIKVKIQAEYRTLNKYQQIKAGLMQDVLTGKVEVQTNDVA